MITNVFHLIVFFICQRIMVKTIISMSLWQISVRSQALNKYFFSTDGLRFTWLGKPHNYLSLWPTAKGLGPNLRISSIPCLLGQINYFSLDDFCVGNFCCNFKIQAIKRQSVPQGRQTSGEHPQYRGLRIVLGHHNFSPNSMQELGRGFVRTLLERVVWCFQSYLLTQCLPPPQA